MFLQKTQTLIQTRYWTLDIRHWTRGVNIFGKEFVITPVCTGRHWMLVIVKTNYGDGVSIMILDSANRPSSRSSTTCRPSVQHLVRNYLQDEWVAKSKQKAQNISLEEVSYRDVPQQPNDTDCGAYVMKFFTKFSSDLPFGHWPNCRPRFTKDEVEQLCTSTSSLFLNK